MSYPTNPHFAFPFIMQAANAAVVEQDSPDEVFACVRAAVGTPRGLRVDLPQFGMPDQVFRQKEVNIGEMRQALEQFEPRAQYAIDAQPDVFDALISRVTIEVRSNSDA